MASLRKKLRDVLARSLHHIERETEMEKKLLEARRESNALLTKIVALNEDLVSGSEETQGLRVAVLKYLIESRGKGRRDWFRMDPEGSSIFGRMPKGDERISGLAVSEIMRSRSHVVQTTNVKT